MHFARLAGFQHQADARARAFADQMMMHAGHGQQGGNGRQFGPRRGRTRSRMLAPDSTALLAQAHKSSMALTRRGLAVASLEQDGQRDGLEAGAG